MESVSGLLGGLVALVFWLLPVVIAVWAISTLVDIQNRVKNIEEKLDSQKKKGAK